MDPAAPAGAAPRPLALAPPPDPVRASHTPPRRAKDELVRIEAPARFTPVAAAWSLPAADVFNYWPVARLDSSASAVVSDAFDDRPGVRGSACYCQPGVYAGVLVCWLELADSGDAESLADDLGAVFDRPWTPRLETSVFENASQSNTSFVQLLERDIESLALASRMAAHFHATSFPLYFARKYGQSDSAVFAKHRELMTEWLRLPRAVRIIVSPTVREDTRAAPLSDTSRSSGIASFLDDAPLPRGPVSAPLAGRKIRTLSSGLATSSVSVPGVTYAAYDLVFPDSNAGSELLHEAAARFWMSPSKKDLKDVTYVGFPRANHQGGATTLGFTANPSWPLDKLLTALKERAKRIRWQKPSSTAIARWRDSLLSDWRSPAYWIEQFTETAFWEVDDFYGFTPDEVDAVAATPQETADAFLAQTYHPTRGTLLAVGNVVGNLDDLVNATVASWKSTVTPADRAKHPQRRKKIAPARTLLLPTINDNLGTVALITTCPIKPRGADPLREAAVATVAGKVVGDVVYFMARQDAGAAYSPAASIALRHGGHEVSLYAQVAAAELPVAIELFDRALVRLASTPLDATWLRRAHRAAIEEPRMRLDSARATLGWASALAAHPSGLAVNEGWSKAVAAVTAEDIQGAFAWCPGHEQRFLFGAKEAVLAQKIDWGEDGGTLDWVDQHLQRTEKWSPSRLAAERRAMGAR